MHIYLKCDKICFNTYNNNLYFYLFVNIFAFTRRVIDYENDSYVL